MERWQALFCENVGWHTDYTQAPGRYAGLRPRAQWARFYDAYEKRVPRHAEANRVSDGSSDERAHEDRGRMQGADPTAAGRR